MEYKKIEQVIFNPINEKIKALAQLFPSTVKDGEVDFESLKEELGQFESVDKEKYELTWAGKLNAKKTFQEEILGKTLKYVPEDSKHSGITENIYIEGDNLEVLKLIRQNYYNSIKMIYIDPPYNTGNDFVYKDNFDMTQKESDMAEGIRDEEGNNLVQNPKSSNRFHANWLSMMYPRLKVAKDLMTDDGVILVSIDENEMANLKFLLMDIFDEGNWVADIVWQGSSKNDEQFVSMSHEYLLIFAKNKDVLSYSDKRWQEKKEGLEDIYMAYEKIIKTFPEDYDKQTKELKSWYANLSKDHPAKDHSHYSIIDKNGIYFPDNISGPKFGQYRYDVFHPINGKKCKEPAPGWRYPPEVMLDKINKNLIHFGENEITVPCRKSYLKDHETTSPRSILYKDGRAASGVVSKLFGEKKIFDNPKDHGVLARFISLATKENDIILDFFSGSASTAHAVFELNKEAGKRKFILVQLPEKTSEKSAAFNAGYLNICEIGKERIRRAGELIKEENKDKVGIENLDIGFKAFRVSDTNIRWTHNALSLIETPIEELQFSDKDRLDFMPHFTDVDVVYEVLLRQRDIPLSSKIEKLSNIGGRTYMFASSYIVSLEEVITKELVEALAAIEPLPIKFVFRDSAFEDDIALKDETIRRLQALIARNTGNGKKAYTVEFI